jgi:SAM-dependent methyltransferase
VANTWEQAVEWLRQQPDQQTLVRDCYFDDPLIEACERFVNSEEWQATLRYLPRVTGKVLDLGAGRGISSYGLAKAGWQVTALEPDPSNLVGAGAIRNLAQEAQLPITVIEEFGERLPLDDASFELVMARQVLHHAHDLPQLMREVGRVLKRGGTFIATREHVITKADDLPKFLAKHPLHHLYGGENAFTLEQYVGAIRGASLTLKLELGPWESTLNSFPIVGEALHNKLTAPLKRRFGTSITTLLTHERTPWSAWVLHQLGRQVSQRDHSPGRLYSFVAVKP